MFKNLFSLFIIIQFNSCFVFIDKRDKHLNKIKNEINIEIDFIYSDKRFIFEINSKNEINMFNLNLIITDSLGNKKFQKFFRKEISNKFLFIIDKIGDNYNDNVSLTFENYLYFKNNEYTTKEDIDNFFKNKKEYRNLILKKGIVILEYDTYKYDSLLNRIMVKDSVMFNL